MHRALLFPIGMLAALLVTSSPAIAPASAAAPSQSFAFNWSGAMPPAQPLIFTGSPNWDVSVHRRGMSEAMYPTLAQHGTDCSAPPNTHLITQLMQAVFICNNHLMTSISDSGYGAIALTPNQIVDFSQGPATISFNVSTLHLNTRNWLTFWVTPWNESMVHPLAEWGELQGPPRHAVRITGTAGNAGATKFSAMEISDFQKSPEFGRSGIALEQLMPTSATVRTRFELTVSRTHLRFGVPSVGLWWVDNDFPTPLPFDQAIFQVNDESYDPCKDQVGGPCSSDTWHWSNVAISPAISFTMLQGDALAVTPHTSPTVHFAAPAPAGAHLRFEAIGPNVQVAFNGGPFAPASMQQQMTQQPDRWANYWVSVPQGTTSVSFQAQRWWGGDWWVRDPAIWALTAPPAGLSVPPLAPPSAPPQSTPPPVQSVPAVSSTENGSGTEGSPPPTMKKGDLAAALRSTPGALSVSAVLLAVVGLLTAGLLIVVGTRMRRRRRRI